MGTFAKAFNAALIAAWLAGSVASASEFKKFARKDQVAASDVIAVGRVLSTGSAWTADHSAIQTRSEIEIDEAWKGAPSERVTVITPGGTVDGIAAKIDGTAEFAAGEQVLVFLKLKGSDFETVGMRFGKYEIVGDAVVGNLPTDIVEAQRYEQVSLPLDDVRAEVAKLVGKKP